MKNSSIRFSVLFVCLLTSLVGCKQQPPEIREIFISMNDGVLLAGDLYVPADFDSTKSYPIILEYLPYRKDEHRRSRYGVFNYFVQKGYLVARVDIRGTGRSHGKIVPYEYSDIELDDGEVVIDFLSQLPFSNGNVAVFGISWGGFNALQLAIRKPPALKTIISLMSTDDLYQDDVHFMDGIMHIDAYEVGRDLDNAMPASPDFILDSAYFEERFYSDPWFVKYKKQQTDGEFWDRASLNSHYKDLEIPVFLVAGLYDGYRDLVERFFNSTKVPKRAIIGPYNHTWPHTSSTSPRVEWRKEIVDWLDIWMRDQPAEFPELIFYQRDYHPPGFIEHVPGKWKVISKWDDYHYDDLILYMDNGKLTDEKKLTGMDSLRSDPSDGIEGGGPVMWWGDWPEDQSLFDEKCLYYEREIKEVVEIMGYPKVRLCVQSPNDHTNWIVRLNDVAPDGQVTLVTGAGFNSTHRNSPENPLVNPEMETFCMDIELHWTTWTFKPGHRLRLAISNAQWPMFWPAPTTGTNYVITGGKDGSSLILPLTGEPTKTGYGWEGPKPDPMLPEYLVKQGETTSGFAEVSRTAYDTTTKVRRVIAINEGEQAYPWGVYHNYESITHSTSDLNPANTSVDAEYNVEIQLEGRHVFLESILNFTSDADSFYYQYSRRISENDSLLNEHNWNESFLRDFQ